MRTNATTYQELDALLGNRESRKVGNNTYAERLGDGVIGIRLHQTHVVILSATRVVLNTGGWNTVTTKDRINTYLPQLWSLVQERGQWFLRLHVCTNGEGRVRLVNEIFHDGIVIDLSLGQHGGIVAESEALR